MKKVVGSLIITAFLLPFVANAGKVTDLISKSWEHWLFGSTTRPSSLRHIAVDEGGRIHIAYYDWAVVGNDTIPKVYYRYSDNCGSTWSAAQEVASEDEANHPSLAVDYENGTPYVFVGNKIWKNGNDYSFDVPYDHDNSYDIGGGPLAINTPEGYGMFYSNKLGNWNRTSTPQLFALSTLQTPTGWKAIPYEQWATSCSWANNRDLIVASQWRNWEGTAWELGRRVHYTPWETDDINDWQENPSDEGFRGAPSTTSIGADVWAVYSVRADAGYGESSVRYKTATAPDYLFFPLNSSGNLIASSDEAQHVRNSMVQVADGFPLVVWTRYFTFGEIGYYGYKIYYSFFDRTPGKLPGWTTPTRLTTTPDYLMEGYPQVAMDFKNKKAHFLWTQRPNPAFVPYPQDFTLEFASIDFSSLYIDTVYVTRPAGGERWRSGSTERITWYRGTSNQPDAITLHLYHNDNEWWWIKTMINPTADYYDWKVGTFVGGSLPGFQTYNNCQIRVGFLYGDLESGEFDGTPYAFSAPFTITPELNIQPDLPEITKYGKGVFETHPTGDGYLLSAGSGENNLRNISDGNEVLGYIEPNDTSRVIAELTWYSSPDTILLHFSRDGGKTYTYATGGIFHDSTIVDTSYSDTSKTDTFFLWRYVDTLTWVSPASPTNGGYLRLMGIDGTSDTVYSEAKGPYYVIAPGGCQFSTYANQNIMSLNDDADKIGLAYTSTISGSTNYNVVYMESDDGLDFSAPDTVDLGNSAGFSGGACAWKRAKATTAAPKDSLYYAYQTSGSFSTPYLLGFTPTVADSGRFAPVGILSENDTVRMIVKATQVYKNQYNNTCSKTVLIYLKFLETSPNNILACDTLVDSSITGTTALYDPAPIAPTLVKNGSTIYGAYTVKGGCGFCTITPSGFIKGNIGYGSYPHVGISEGNITYTYLGQGDTTLIRLWRYIDDTAWVERDTFKLDTVATFFTGDRGTLFGVQYAGSGRDADVFGYSPTAETFLRQGYYTGYYAHPYVDDKADEFSWVVAYADYADDSAYTFLHTIRRPLYVPITAAYMESDTKRSPWTIVRDTNITYDDIAVDSARDSLVYRIPCLNDDLDYSLTLHFYHEADSTAQLQITVGSKVDTIEVASEQGAWFHDSIPSNTDTLNIKIKRLSSSTYTFVPVSRIVIDRRSAEGFFIQSDMDEKMESSKMTFCLYQPLPNPFAGQATIRFALPSSTRVNLKIYDVSGRLVTTLIDGKVNSGEHSITWTGQDALNRQCASGVYFVRLTADKYTAAKKMVLIK